MRVRLAQVPAEAPPKPLVLPPTSAAKVARYLADLDARGAEAAKLALLSAERDLVTALTKGGSWLASAISLRLGSDWVTWRVVHGEGDPWYDAERLEAHAALDLARPMPRASLGVVDANLVLDALVTGRATRLRRFLVMAQAHGTGTSWPWTSEAEEYPRRHSRSGLPPGSWRGDRSPAVGSFCQAHRDIGNDILGLRITISCRWRSSRSGRCAKPRAS